MKASYAQAISFVLKQEGGYTNDPQDPGGPTNWGITIFDARKYWKADAQAADVKAMPLQVAKDIYQSKYWAAVSGDDIAAGLDLCTFDSAVNSGTGRAWKWLSTALGAVPTSNYKALATASQTVKDVPASIKTFCKARLSFLQSLKTWDHFKGGWGKRVAQLQALAITMALQASGKTTTEVKTQLGKEATTVTKKNSSDVAKTTTASTATGVGTWSFWEWDLTHVTILLVAVGVVAFMIRQVVQNNHQITAFNDQIAALNKVANEQV